jgi:lipopolysaccharide/colanic/teichoic acid biosynthesis glycosyltransferase
MDCYTAVTACNSKRATLTFAGGDGCHPLLTHRITEAGNTMASHCDNSGRAGPVTIQDIAPSFELDQWIKRLLDIVAATTGLILFSPILLLTSLAIKLDSPGPIFIRGGLCGFSNRPIQVLRFRLVTVCAEGDRFNPTLTTVGHILSQTGIDELPQLFNVLRGEISIVGRRNVPRWPARMS